MTRLLMIASVLALAACDEVSYSVKTPTVEKTTKMISVEVAGAPAKMLPAAELKDTETLASAKEMLGTRCDTVTSLDRFEGHPIGGDILVYRATCPSGEYQLLQIGDQVAIAAWTGKLADPRIAS